MRHFRRGKIHQIPRESGRRHRKKFPNRPGTSHFEKLLENRVERIQSEREKVDIFTFPILVLRFFAKIPNFAATKPGLGRSNPSTPPGIQRFGWQLAKNPLEMAKIFHFSVFSIRFSKFSKLVSVRDSTFFFCNISDERKKIFKKKFHKIFHSSFFTIFTHFFAIF
jgi:hypothetical protein